MSGFLCGTDDPPSVKGRTRLDIVDQEIVITLPTGAVAFSRESVSNSLLLQDVLNNASTSADLDLHLHNEHVHMWMQYINGQFTTTTASISDLCTLLQVRLSSPPL